MNDLIFYLIGIFVGWFITFLYYQHKIRIFYFEILDNLDIIVKNVSKYKKKFNKNLEKEKYKI